ncbi:MAG: glycosyltransferase family 2 protein [Cyanobacteriota bacterium]
MTPELDEKSEHTVADSSPPFVSIIIPTYNSGFLFEQTLASCLKIKDIGVEILVVDDGSTDGTPEWILQHHPGVRLHRLSSHSGSGAAGRNQGLALARGRYVKFLDHDDLLQPRGLQEECREAMRSDADIVMSRWAEVAIQDDGRFRKRTLRQFAPPDPARLIDAILNGEPTPYIAAALYKRSYVLDERWDASVAIIDDFDWFCRMALKGGRITSVGSLAYVWRLHPHSIQGRSHGQAQIYKELTFARFKVYQKLEQLLLAQGLLTDARKRQLARRYYEYLRCYARYDFGQYRQLVARMRRLDPGFTVDAGCEPDPSALWLIRRLGLTPFFGGYAALQRSGDAVKVLANRLRSSRRLRLVMPLRLSRRLFAPDRHP